MIQKCGSEKGSSRRILETSRWAWHQSKANILHFSAWDGGIFLTKSPCVTEFFPPSGCHCAHRTLIECVTRTTMNRECGPLQIRWIALSVCLALKSRNYRFYIRIARLPLWTVRYMHWIGHIKQLFQDLHRGCPILQSEGLTKGNHNCFGPRMRSLCTKGSIMS